MLLSRAVPGRSISRDKLCAAVTLRGANGLSVIAFYQWKAKRAAAEERAALTMSSGIVFDLPGFFDEEGEEDETEGGEE